MDEGMYAGLAARMGADLETELTWLVEQLPEVELRRRLEAVEAHIIRLRRAEKAYRAALYVLELAREEDEREEGDSSVAGEVRNATANGGRPGVTEAVRRILADAPGHMLSVKEIMRALEVRDWLPDAKDPRKAVGATLSRMTARTGELERIPPARYRLKAAPDVEDMLTLESV